MTPDEKDIRGVRAKELMDNPLLKDAVKTIKEAIIHKWSITDPSDTDQREYLWKLHEAATSFENVLFGYIQTGEIARKQLQETKTFRQRIKSVM